MVNLADLKTSRAEPIDFEPAEVTPVVIESARSIEFEAARVETKQSYLIPFKPSCNRPHRR